MMKAQPSKYEFHKKPYGAKDCPICGFQEKYAQGRSSHRAVREDEGIEAAYLRIRKRGTLEKIIPVGIRGACTHRGGSPPGPSRKSIENLKAVARLFCQGLKFTEIAPTLEMNIATVCSYKYRFPDLWEAECDKLLEQHAQKLRSAAGSDAVLEDPTLHIAKCKMFEKWLKTKGKELFPKNKQMTLCSFFEEIYCPQFLFQAVALTKQHYRGALRKWKYLTGDPPVTKITNELLAKFREAIEKISGRNGLKAAANTVRHYQKAIQHLLDKLGPSGPRNREALGVLKIVPFARYVAKEYKIPRTIGEDKIVACYEAAAAMNVPWFEGIKPPAWWKALLVLAWNTGLRPKAIFSAEMKHLDWATGRLTLPASCMKSKRPFVAYLNETVMEHLRRIRTERKMLFPWPHPKNASHERCTYDRFHHHFKKLQRIAGLEGEERFTLKVIRKTLGTRMWEISPQAASFALSHTSMDVTREHYVDGGPMLARALQALPQPAIFQPHATPQFTEMVDLGAGI